MTTDSKKPVTLFSTEKKNLDSDVTDSKDLIVGAIKRLEQHFFNHMLTNDRPEQRYTQLKISDLSLNILNLQ